MENGGEAASFHPAFAPSDAPPSRRISGVTAAAGSVWKWLAALRDSAWMHFTTLFAFALILNREGTWVPGGNEKVYLLYLLKAWRPSFLATDWTFQEHTAGHLIFNVLFGWPTRFLPLETVGWIGRFGSWAILFIALVRIGSHFRIKPWMVWAGLMLWLVERQSFVATEWIIGTFEAKCVAYACLLFSLDLILRGRIVLPAILTGLAFSFHSAVGMWGGAAIGLAVATQFPMRTTLKFAMWAALFALPGVWAAMHLMAGHGISPREANFLVTVEMPFHLDPLTFGKGKIATLYLMLLFNWLHLRRNPEDEKLKFLFRFELFTGGFFLLGVAFRLMGKFTLVELFPFRVFAVIIMLFFFWHIAAVYYHRRENPPTPGLIALGVILLLLLPNPLVKLKGLAADQLPQWHRPHDDFQIAGKWVREHLPPNAVVIAPPWRKDAFYVLRHPLIAEWDAPRLNAITPWRQRIEALVGDVSHLTGEEILSGEMNQQARDFYRHLNETQLATLQQKYGGDVLVTAGHYRFPVLFASGNVTVYQLPRSLP